MVVSVSGLLFSIVLGVIGAIIVLILTAVMGYLVKLIRRFFAWISDNFKKWKNNP
jgi:ABC-type Fe3+ transport system permease subunit